MDGSSSNARSPLLIRISAFSFSGIARVFVTALGSDAETKDVFAGLSKASGFVRNELGRRLALRYLPEVVFVKDVSGPRGDRVLQLLGELHDKTDTLSENRDGHSSGDHR